jgi:predicted ABC-class ATPase
MLLEELPAIVRGALHALDPAAVERHIHAAEDSERLRDELDGLVLVAFVADGAVLPRRSGASDKPLPADEAVVFRSPESLRVAVQLPHAGTVTGLGIPRGVTLIIGGGYHGKSTLLHAIESGIYNHVPGDGREFCVADPRTVKVRAYSGSTSQAAAIVEALEMDARVLLMDEDTSASNFMIRDRKMQELVGREEEPITPYIERVRQLYERGGVSSVLVLGGVGDCFEVADTVIQMLRYEPLAVTEAAKKIARDSPEKRRREHADNPKPGGTRFLESDSVDPLNEYGKRNVFATEPHRFHFGAATIDLTDVEQIVELSQTKAIAQAIESMGKTGDAAVPIKEAIDRCLRIVEEKGLDGLFPKISGHFARFRDIELACALNRLRTARIAQW